jgi:RNase H-fold protein (predicted Holliday junction resolvase)
VRFVAWDERLTTRMAVAGSRGRRGSKKKRGAAMRVDDLAAAHLLREYLERRENR